MSPIQSDSDFRAVLVACAVPQRRLVAARFAENAGSLANEPRGKTASVTRRSKAASLGRDTAVRARMAHRCAAFTKERAARGSGKPISQPRRFLSSTG